MPGGGGELRELPEDLSVLGVGGQVVEDGLGQRTETLQVIGTGLVGPNSLFAQLVRGTTAAVALPSPEACLPSMRFRGEWRTLPIALSRAQDRGEGSVQGPGCRIGGPLGSRHESELLWTVKVGSGDRQ